MLPRRELTIGKSYVNERFQVAREVVEVGRKTVKYKAYDLETGQLCGATRECQKQHFVHWANREATDEEMANLQHDELNALYLAHDSAPKSETGVHLEQIRMMTRNSMFNR